MLIKHKRSKKKHMPPEKGAHHVSIFWGWGCINENEKARYEEIHVRKLEGPYQFAS
jgi:hypothetical protein